MPDASDEEYQQALGELPSRVRHRLQNELYAIKLGVHLVGASYHSGEVSIAKECAGDVDRLIQKMMQHLVDESSRVSAVEE